MLGFGSCWRPASNRTLLGSCSRRSFTVSAASFAKAAPSKDGKKKVKQGFKLKSDPKAKKVKKGGMTHLTFRDAVRALNFEKQAVDFSNLEIGTLNFETLADSKDKVVKYSEAAETSLTQLDSFKKYQHHEMFRRPVSMVSDNTMDLQNTFLSKLDQETKTNRVCLVGEKGVGKSLLVAQAQALALSKFSGDVVLLHLDYPEKIIEGSSDYIFNKRLGLYQQPMFTKRWIKKLRAANEAVLRKLPLTRDSSFVAKKVEHNLKKGENSLYDFLVYNHDFGKVGPSTAFQFFVEELVHHSAQVPILVTIDNFNALTFDTYTQYRHPDFTRIHFTEFEMGSFLLKLASGDLSFKKGGILMAESKDISYSHTLPVALNQEQYDPYWKTKQCDRKVAESLLLNGGITPFEVQTLSKDQTRELMEFWEAAGVLQVRDYPTKADHRTSEEIIKEREERLASEIVDAAPEEDAEQQFERIVNTHYVMSSGNPGHLVRAVNISY